MTYKDDQSSVDFHMHATCIFVHASSISLKISPNSPLTPNNGGVTAYARDEVDYVMHSSAKLRLKSVGNVFASK